MMSDPGNRRDAKTTRRILDQLRAAELQRLDMQREMARLSNQLAAAKYTWRLLGSAVLEGQKPDSWLREDWTDFTQKARGEDAVSKSAKRLAKARKVTLKALSKQARLEDRVERRGAVLRKGGLSATARAAIAGLDEAHAALEEPGGDRGAKAARWARAEQTAQIELIKQARQRVVPPWAGG
jgi:hypothetical protein